MTRRSYRPLSLPALVLTLLAPLGCGDNDGGSGSECTTLICPCESNDDCSGGQVCTSLGICGDGEVADVIEPDAGDIGSDADNDVDAADSGADVPVDVMPDSDADEDTDVDAADITTDADTASEVTDADVMIDVEETTDADVADIPMDTDVADVPEDADVAADTDVETDTGPDGPFPVVVPPAANPWVAFARQPSDITLSQVFITPLDGGEARQLFDGDDYLSTFSPTWSPDGTRLAFVAFTLTAERELVVVDVTTGEREPFSLAPLTIFDNLSWAPVGGQIALNGTSDVDADNEIYLFDVDADEPALVQLTDNDIADTYPRWINDGRVAYVSALGDALEVFTLDTLTDTPAPVQLSFGTGMRGAFAVDPSGELLFYSVASGPGAFALTRNALTSSQVQSFDASPSEGDPYVSRDGQSLVFSSARGGTVQIYRSDLAVSAPVAITGSSQRAGAPCISQVGSAEVAISESFDSE